MILFTIGANVILACRDVAQGKEAAENITTKSKRVVVMELDLASFASIRKFADEVNQSKFLQW